MWGLPDNNVPASQRALKIYRTEIDGLRALSVLAVLFFHAGFQSFSGGFIGVDIFFVISGYLITLRITADLSSGIFSLAHFYESRARRILPALVVVLLACLPLAWWLLFPHDMLDFSKAILHSIGFTANFFYFHASGYFETSTELKPLAHTWSLAVEEQFYLLFPLALMGLCKLGQRWLLPSLIALALSSFAFAVWMFSDNPMKSFYLLQGRGWELLLGSIVAVSSSQLNGKFMPRLLRNLLSTSGLLLVIWAICTFDNLTQPPMMVLPVLGVGGVLLFTMADDWIGRLLSQKLLVAIGLMSYSVYLWHQPLFAFARHLNPLGIEPLAFIALIALSMLLGCLSWHFVERPFRNRVELNKASFRMRVSTGIALLVGFGVLGLYTEGFTFRYPQDAPLLALMKNEAAGKYVARNFDSLLMRGFDLGSKKRKVLVIGDSFAQDIVNAVLESDLQTILQISTRKIQANCDNFFLVKTSFKHARPNIGTRSCEGRDLYEDDALRALMLQADEIWFASRWQTWQIPFVSTSVAQTVAFSGKRVRVFGTKNWTNFSLRYLVSLTKAERVTYQSSWGNDATEMNTHLKRTLDTHVFVDVQNVLCGINKTQCPIFTPQADLITYDGLHLTRPGAEWLGQRLLAFQLLQ